MRYCIGVRVNKIGRTKTIQIDTDIGLTVRYDGVYNVYITLSSRYRGKVVGLCGNYNGNINDEYLDVNSHLSVSVSEFADSWNVDRRCKGTTEPENPCLAANNIAQEAKKRCQLLKEQPFAKCNNLVKPDSGFIEDCEYDVCACNNHPASCLCEEFDAYATMCSIVGDPIIWRNHSQFSECNSSCAEAPCRNGATCINRGKDYNCKCADGYSGKQCDIRTCENPKPLGMESRKIADSRITASSQYSASYRASYARLNSNTYWLSKPNNRNQWLKIDFKYRATITDILSQGRGSSNQYVRTYTLSYSDDGINFKSYQRSGKKRVLKANVNDKCIAKTTLEPVIVARFIRIHPVTWKGHISMRVEFIGCFEGICF
ncbi:EGF-like repeat and discoidin I-like domain-containing 3 [Paramuricea clavata]|uniref:EGF-like repeat and discoidin I-like domain-containing 3 n=1 Tax=Paramuricea clavata TaxID=317549 RepID=A0A7D9HF87_PARCT|nr:EGF-like repeat and discoidin I-like domain-containing 3 [Paramuricea clavata]